VYWADYQVLYRVLQNKHQAVSQGVHRFGKRSLFSYMRAFTKAAQRRITALGAVFQHPVDLFSVPGFHHDNHQHIIVDFIDDPVETLANSIPLLAGKLLRTRRARVTHQFVKAPDYANDIFSGD
jgi:hypothetical protein